MTRWLIFGLIALMTCGCFGCAMDKILGGEAILDQPAEVVQFELVNGAIIVPVRINGSEKPLRFLLSTGSLNAISTEAAAEHGIEKIFEIIAKDATGAVRPLPVGALESVTVGKGVTVTRASTHIEDLKPVTDRTGIKIDGVIGNNFLRFFETTIDYRNTQIVFKSPYGTNIDEIIGGRGLFVMPFDLSIKEGLAPKINGKVNGTVRTTFTIDTGNLGDTFLMHDVAAYLGYLDVGTKLEVAAYEGERIGGFTGLYQQPIVGKLESLSFGVMKVGPHLFLAAQSEANSIGYSVLRNYRMTINFEKSVVVFREWPAPVLTKRLFSCGLGIGEKDGAMIITGLVKGSAASIAGLAPFDRVLEVNGKPTEQMDLLEIQNILVDDTVDTLTLKVHKNSGPQTVTLKKVDLLQVDSCRIEATGGKD
jgi:PDZ domain/Aspartyl protease